MKSWFNTFRQIYGDVENSKYLQSVSIAFVGNKNHVTEQIAMSKHLSKKSRTGDAVRDQIQDIIKKDKHRAPRIDPDYLGEWLTKIGNEMNELSNEN